MNILGVLVRGMQASESALQYQSQNIANMNTPGYKSARVDFSGLLRSSSSAASNSLVIPYSNAPGAYVATGQALDIYPQADVYFPVEDAKGIAYSRFGRLSLNATGELLDGNGRKLTIDADVDLRNAGPLRLESDGTVWVGDEKAASIDLVKLDGASLDADGYVRSFSAKTELPFKPLLLRGYEAANVNFADEVVGLMMSVRQMNGLQYAYKSIEGIYDKALTDLGRF